MCRVEREGAMSDDTCRVCGLLLALHSVKLIDGVAHTIVFDGSHRHSCSAVAGERQFQLGRLDALLTVIRALRWQAGRMRNSGRTWSHEQIAAYADRLQRDRERLIRAEQEYFK
jgi:hypothetical protein